MQAGRFHVSSCDLIDAGRALEFIFYVSKMTMYSKPKICRLFITALFLVCLKYNLN